MRIGIFTLPLHTNYGGILQAYAMQKVLKNLGHEVWLIEREKNFKLPLIKVPTIYVRRLLRKYILRRKDAVIFLERKRRKEFDIISIYTKKFIEKEITPSLSVKEIKDIPDNFFDVIVVGSDQIWRPRYNYPRIENAYLDFTQNWENLRRISYAASFGTAHWEYTKSQTQACKNLVKMFDSISVREDTGIEFCKDKFETKAKLVLDPTMLLDVYHYNQMIKGCSKNIEGEMFIYVLDSSDEMQETINTISSMLNFIPFYTSTDRQDVEIEKRIATPVEEWLKSFSVARYIVTDSFHACVFAILFNKPFIAFGNLARGISRFRSLLKMFMLEERLVTSMNELTEQKILAEIDWNKTNKILEEYKDISMEFLRSNLRE